MPYHAVTAWHSQDLTITNTKDTLKEHQHPELDMKRVFCAHYGEVLFNTNSGGWWIVSPLAQPEPDYGCDQRIRW